MWVSIFLPPCAEIVVIRSLTPGPAGPFGVLALEVRPGQSFLDYAYQELRAMGTGFFDVNPGWPTSNFDRGQRIVDEYLAEKTRSRGMHVHRPRRGRHSVYRPVEEPSLSPEDERILDKVWADIVAKKLALGRSGGGGHCDGD